MLKLPKLGLGGKASTKTEKAKVAPAKKGTIKMKLGSSMSAGAKKKPPAKSGGGFNVTNLFGTKKSAAPAEKKTTQTKTQMFTGTKKVKAPMKAPAMASKEKGKGKPGGVFSLFGGGGDSKPAQSKTQKKNIQKIAKSFKAPSAKPAVTKSGSSSGVVTADARRAGARKKPQDLKQEMSKWFGPNRALYLPPGLLDPKEDVPKYLDGTLAGDYGFDPLGLGDSKEQVAKYREYELIHARWAMLAVPGVFFPEALGVSGGTWFETGKVALQQNLGYTAPPLFAVESNPLPLPLIVLIQIGLMGLVEKYRTEGEGPSKGWAPVFGKWDGENVFAGLNKINPGGPLNPLSAASSSPEEMKLMQEREIKNGRLAMISMLGVFAQALATGEGPYANWSKHVADPFGYNLTTMFGEQITL